jgi:hypothetical protein
MHLSLLALADRGAARRTCDRLARAEDAAALSWWSEAQRSYFNTTKVALTSRPNPACQWDCANRATMLEPIAADVLKNGVEGDFLEAGVASGGISVFMAATLRAAGALGDARPGARTMWVADSFRGLPPPEEYIHGFAGTRRTAAAGTLPGISKKSLLGIHSRDRKARIWHGGGVPDAPQPR